MPKAAALRYKPREDAAPQVVAKGSGEIAQRIVSMAREHEIPIFKDASLVELLVQLPLNATIPPTLYQAVAEVLAFLYRLKERQKKGRRSS